MAACAEGRSRNDVDLAPKIGSDPTTLSKWRANPKFREWFEKACTVRYRGGMRQLLIRTLELGVKGSVSHAEFFARYSGEVEHPPPLDGGTAPAPQAGPVLNILVPRPDWPVAVTVASGARPQGGATPAAAVALPPLVK